MRQELLSKINIHNPSLHLSTYSPIYPLNGHFIFYTRFNIDGTCNWPYKDLSYPSVFSDNTYGLIFFAVGQYNLKFVLIPEFRRVHSCSFRNMELRYDTLTSSFDF